MCYSPPSQKKTNKPKALAGPAPLSPTLDENSMVLVVDPDSPIEVVAAKPEMDPNPIIFNNP